MVVAMDLQDRLESLGYQVAGHTGSGEESLELVEQLRPDLVLMDIRLQGDMDGIAAARVIRDRFHRPVVFLTAYSEEATLQRAKLVQPFGYLLKPFEDRELKTAIEMALFKHQAELEIRRLSQLYAVLSHVNQSVARARSQAELFPQVCRAIVNQGEFNFAWIGWLDPLTREVKPAAQWGESGGYLEACPVFADDRPAGRGPTGVAVREGRISVCNDIAREKRMAPWQSAAARAGIHSSGAFPLRCQDRIVGAVNLCSSETGFFHDREIGLLEELSLDISFALDHLETEAREQQSKAELETIYDSTPLMICLVNPQRQVERMNRTMAEFAGAHSPPDTGRRAGDILGCVNALDDPRGCGFGAQCQPCPLRLAVVKTFETGQTSRHVEAKLFLARAGLRREIEISASTALVRLRDEPKVLVCLEDITRRKRLEAQIMQSQKMEAVGQLAGGVAHDFNNILAATLLHLQLLRQDPNLDPELAAALGELEQGAQRAANLTRQLLLFSHRQVMQIKRVDLNEVIAGLMKMLHRLLGEHIDTSFSQNAEPVWLEADPGMLEQIVMNLCINARDAMPRGGQLKLSLQRQAFTAENAPLHAGTQPGPFVCLSVTDTGCGMDEPTLKRIFEPFFTTKPLGKGTGLGLPTVHGIAAQHHGWVEVESAVGRGTTFRVFLPAAEPPAAAKPQTAQPKLRGGAEAILLVEDDPQMRRMVRLTLRRFGYEILEAADGDEALQLWALHGPRVSLLFTDMIMPGGMSGLDLARRLRESKPDLKVLISSGYAPDLLQQEGGLPAGVTFLAKPYDPKSLAETVRERLDEN